MTDDPIVRKADINRLTGFSDTTILKMEKRGLFPRRFKINPDGKIVGWRLSDIQAFINARAEAA